MKTVAILVSLFLSACQPQEMYRIIPGSPTLKLNVQTGETWRYDSGFADGPTWKRVKEAPAK